MIINNKKIKLVLLFSLIVIGFFGFVGAASTSSNLESTTNAVSEDSNEEAFSGIHSVHLQADGSGVGNEGRIKIMFDTPITLNNLQNISWMTNVTEGYIPHVDVLLDTDEDSESDDALVFEYDKVQTPSDQSKDTNGDGIPDDVSDMNYQRNQWVNTFNDKGIVNDSAEAWLSSGCSGPDNGANYYDNLLSDWKSTGYSGDVTNCAGDVVKNININGNTLVTGLELEVDGWITTSEAYVDDVRINGEVVEYFDEVPAITNVYTDPAYPNPNKESDKTVYVYSTITDADGIQDYPELRWRIIKDGVTYPSSGYYSDPQMDPEGGNEYSGIIGITQPKDNMTVKYKIEAEDNLGNRGYTSYQYEHLFTYDGSAPTVDVNGNPDDLLVDKDGVTATVECSDSISGCDNSTYLMKKVSVGTNCLNENYSSAPESLKITSPTYVCAKATDNAGNTGYSDDPVEFNVYNKIQDAIDDASSEDIINVTDGTYSEDLNIDSTKTGLSIIGDSRENVIIDVSFASGASGCSPLSGICVLADDVTLDKFTVSGGTGETTVTRAIKLSEVSGTTVSNVKINGITGSGFDIINSDNIALSTLEVIDNGGAGFFMKNDQNVDFNDITTDNNPWGGIAFATDGDYADPTTTGITFSGTNSFGELDSGNVGIYLEIEDGGNPMTYSNDGSSADIDLQNSGINFALHGIQDDAPTERVLFFDTLDNTKKAGQIVPYGHLTGEGRYIEEVSANNFYVEDGMSIQSAVDAASEGATINVGAGTYEPFWTSFGGPEDISIIAVEDTTPRIEGDLGLTGRLVDLRADGTTIRGLEIYSTTLGNNVGVSVSGKNIIIENNTILNILTGIQTTTANENGNVEMINNLIDSEYVGISLQNNKNTVTGNDITADIEGLGIGSTQWPVNDNYLHYNKFDISSGGVAVKVYTSEDGYGHVDGSKLNATDNWWGTVDGTTIAGLVSGNVDYTPWAYTADLDLDHQIPSISVLYPLNNTLYNKTVSELNYSASDSPSGLYSCWYSTDNGITNSTPDSTCSNFIESSSEGQNNWTVYVMDKSGNLNSDTVTFTQDTTAPTISITSPKDNSDLTSDRKVFADVNDELSGIARVNFSLVNASDQTQVYTNGNMTYDNTTGQYVGMISNVLSDVPIGTYNLEVTATDDVGNENTTRITLTAVEYILPDITPVVSSVPSGENSTVQFDIDLAIRNGNAVRMKMSDLSSESDSYTPVELNSRLVYNNTEYPVRNDYIGDKIILQSTSAGSNGTVTFKMDIPDYVAPGSYDADFQFEITSVEV